MENQVLSIEKMQHLKELGLNTSKASMCWVIDCNHAHHLKIHDLFAYKAIDEKVIPAFTLQDILEILPKEIRVLNDDYYDYSTEYKLRIDFQGYYFHRLIYDCTNKIAYHILKQFKEPSLIDAAYEMLCWCIENGHIKAK